MKHAKGITKSKPAPAFTPVPPKTLIPKKLRPQ